MSYSDYYPFGMQMPGRVFNGGGYAFGFNGMLNDNEVFGIGNYIDFGARGLDVRLGRWKVVDPLAYLQPSQSTYKAFLNNPIMFIDPDGRTEWIVHKIVNKKTGGITEIKKVDPSIIVLILIAFSK